MKENKVGRIIYGEWFRLPKPGVVDATPPENARLQDTLDRILNSAVSMNRSNNPYLTELLNLTDSPEISGIDSRIRNKRGEIAKIYNHLDEVTFVPSKVALSLEQEIQAKEPVTPPSKRKTSSLRNFIADRIAWPLGIFRNLPEIQARELQEAKEGLSYLRDKIRQREGPLNGRISNMESEQEQMEQERDASIMSWIFSDPSRVISHALVFLPENNSRMQFFGDYSKYIGELSEGTVKALESLYIDSKIQADNSTCELSIERIQGAKDPSQDLKLEVVEQTNGEFDFKIKQEGKEIITNGVQKPEVDSTKDTGSRFYPIGDVIISQEGGAGRIVGITVWSDDQVKQFIRRKLPTSHKNDPNLLEQLIKMVSHIQRNPVDPAAQVLRGTKLRSIRPRAVPGVDIYGRKEANTRIVYNIYNAQGKILIRLEGVFTHHDAYETFIGSY